MSKFSLKKLPPEVLRSTAQKIRMLRKLASLSQSNLAERSGVSLGSLKRFEASGKISLESFLKLLHILGRLDEFDGILQPGEDIRDIEKLFTNKS
ncbi:MAG: helix-turn-helix domain-containing protein [Bacteroidales bacterium]|nr:helix-turn-helix domain-containing protein [Bacteroidales bacterium]